MFFSVVTAVAALAGSATTGLAQFQAQGPHPDTLRLRAGLIDLSQPRPLTPDSVGPAAAGKTTVLHLSGPMTPDRRAALDRAGVVILDYLPVNAYLARLDRVAPARVAELGFVRWHGDYRPEWKTDPELGIKPLESAQRQAMLAQGLATVVVTLFPQTSDAEAAGVVAAIGAMPGAVVHSRTMQGDSPVVSATINLNSVVALESMPAVQFIEEAPDITERNSTVRWVVQSNIPGVNTLWVNGLTGVGQIVGVIDSRIDTSHCSFSDVNPIGPAHRKLLAYNAPPGPAASHGTHVAGIFAGDAGDTTDTRGIAYQARIVYNQTPTFIQSDVYERLALHHQQGARVHNNSWGANTTNSYTSLVRGVDLFCYDHEEDLVTFATRNGNLGILPVSSPENAKNCLAVGASGDAPVQANHCSGSFGPTTDGRRKPEVFAPGCSIFSAAVGTGCGINQQTGTSMASPAVAGVGLLMRQYFVDGYYPTGAASADGFSPTGALLRAVLINSAVDMTGISGFPSDSEGWGRILADNALYFPGDAARLFVVDRRNSEGLATGQSVDHTVEVVDNAQPLKITLAWTDPPAAVGTSFAPTNDLNLIVISPSNVEYPGNWFSGGQSLAGGSADAVNNVEQVLLAAPEVGVWTVRVAAPAVNVGYQGYALAATGGISQPPAPLSVTVDPFPTIVPPGSSPVVGARINPGSETIVSGPTLYVRLDGGAFQTVPLTFVSGDKWTAAIPTLSCGDVPEFYIELESSLSGTRRVPSDAPAGLFSADVGQTQSTELFFEDFESGLPAGWTATGLWHVTGACQVLPVCGGNQWAYFGNDGPCNYNLGGSTAAVGNLTSPAIPLPPTDVNQRLALRFCASLDRENFLGFDVASLLVDGVEAAIFTAADVSWRDREFDLTPWAGQSVSLTWRFNTVDGFANAQRGWQVDNIRVELIEEVCIPPAPSCPADFNGDGLVNGADLSVLLSNFGSGGATPGSGDANGDGLVNGADLSVLLSAFGTSCN